MPYMNKHTKRVLHKKNIYIYLSTLYWEKKRLAREEYCMAQGKLLESIDRCIGHCSITGIMLELVLKLTTQIKLVISFFTPSETNKFLSLFLFSSANTFKMEGSVNVVVW